MKVSVSVQISTSAWREAFSITLALPSTTTAMSRARGPLRWNTILLLSGSPTFLPMM